MNPSSFKNHPYNSVFQNNETEIVARNIMVILARTGDEFRQLTWEEYRKERLKDGRFSENERAYFLKAHPYCLSEQTARLFSPDWAELEDWVVTESQGRRIRVSPGTVIQIVRYNDEEVAERESTIPDIRDYAKWYYENGRKGGSLYLLD